MKKIILSACLTLILLGGGQANAEGKKATPPPPPPPVDINTKDLILERLGLTPDEIMFLKSEKEKRSEAASAPVVEATSVTRTLTLDLSPGAPSRQIRVNTRKGAALVFTDITGAPWPVIANTNFASDLFQVMVPIEGGAVVTVSAKNDFKQGNLAIFLKDLPTPVIFGLVSGQPEIDERVDVIIQKRGPGAIEPPMETMQIPAHDPLLADVLAGLPPAGGKKLAVKFQDGTEATEASMIRAWLVGEKLYLRTPFSIMSPRPLQSQGSADGMKGYVLNVTPVVLFVEKGQTHQIRIVL